MIGSTARSSMTSRSQYRKMSAGNPQYSEMELIATTLVGSAGVASVTFTDNGAWTGYKHLQIRSVTKDSRTSFPNSPYTIAMNGVAASYYHELTGNGTTVTSTAAAAAYIGQSASAVTPSVYGVSILDILDFASTTKNKTVRTFAGINLVQMLSVLWNSTAAVTSITLTPLVGPFISGSRISLYGIKG